MASLRRCCAATERCSRVELPPGAREVTLNYDIAAYHRGSWVTLIALVLTALLVFADRLRPRTVNA